MPADPQTADCRDEQCQSLGWCMAALLPCSAATAELSVDHLVDARLCCLEIIRCYFWPDPVQRAAWWEANYACELTAENALKLIKQELCPIVTPGAE